MIDSVLRTDCALKRVCNWLSCSFKTSLNRPNLTIHLHPLENVIYNNVMNRKNNYGHSVYIYSVNNMKVFFDLMTNCEITFTE